MGRIDRADVEEALRASAREELASVREALSRGVERGGERRILLYGKWAWGGLGALAHAARTLGFKKLAKVLEWHMTKL